MLFIFYHGLWCARYHLCANKQGYFIKILESFGVWPATCSHTKKKLRRLICAFGYYRHYIEHVAHIVKLLTDLTSKKTPNQLPWERLRSQLRAAHVLHVPRIGEPFVLHTDTSGVAVGATLGQLDQDGVEHPLAFASRVLTGSQCSWSTIEREAYAIIWVWHKFQDTVFGSTITVVCDHNPLHTSEIVLQMSAKLLRWSLALQEFDSTIKYKRGSDNVVADYLSRIEWLLWCQMYEVMWQCMFAVYDQ